MEPRELNKDEILIEGDLIYFKDETEPTEVMGWADEKYTVANFYRLSDAKRIHGEPVKFVRPYRTDYKRLLADPAKLRREVCELFDPMNT